MTFPINRKCSIQDPTLEDHPLQNGRRSQVSTADDFDKSDVQRLSSIEEANCSIVASGDGHEYLCQICSFHCKLKSDMTRHLECCQRSNSNYENDSGSSRKEIDTDMFWNYKSCEFFLTAILSVTTIFEKFGDGLGCYIVNKIMLPIFHGLKHSNYSCSIHRYIGRVLCEATPKEGIKLVHERFSNRRGKPGCNINRDLRMEYLIGMLKKLLGNLGSNFSPQEVEKVNSVVDVKEELFLRMRESHGVRVRSGKRTVRSDERDYEILFKHLTEKEAHLKIANRPFGDTKFPENIMEEERFDKAKFYRWLSGKNKELRKVLEAKRSNATSL